MDKSRLKKYLEKIEHIEERVGDIKTWLVEEEDVKEVEKKTRLAVYKIDFAFLEKDENVLAVLLFGSGAKDQLSTRSDIDFCIVAPEIWDIGEMRSLLKKNYVNLDVVGKRYDIWLFEELPLYMKLQVIENHKVVFCMDLPTLYEYFYFYRKIWEDQKHRQEMDKEELMNVLERL